MAIELKAQEGAAGRWKLAGAATIERRCPECQNALDPSWTQCPYCEARKKAGDKNVGRPARVANPPTAAAPPSHRATRTDSPATSAVGVDARVLALFDDAPLSAKLLGMPRIDLAEAWNVMRPAVERRGAARSAAAPSALQVHHKLVEGLDGVALLMSSAMFLRTMADVEAHFDMSFKTIKSKLEGSLDTASGERAWRAARATMTAADVLGSWDAAREYMHTRNFALGGATPAELVKTADGERVVVNELHAQAEGGPL